MVNMGGYLFSILGHIFYLDAIDMKNTIDLNTSAISLINNNYDVDSYDDLLWRIAVCDEGEILQYAKHIYEKPLLDLPVPMQLVLLRLAALVANAQRSDATEEYVSLLNSLCDPADEKHISDPILNRMDIAKSDKR
jgi:hypothetical protein